MIKDFQAINESKISLENDVIEILSPAKTDYFNSPLSSTNDLKPITNAPFYYQEVTGNFTIKVRIKNNYEYDYDAGSIFIYEDDFKWIKLAFEKSDFDTTAVVSVVTDTFSDDANGVNVEEEYVYLMASRLDDTFSLHYSLNGVDYYLVRIFKLNMSETLKVGLEAQSPTGVEANRYFSNFTLSDYILEDLRSGKH